LALICEFLTLLFASFTSSPYPETALIAFLKGIHSNKSG